MSKTSKKKDSDSGKINTAGTAKKINMKNFFDNDGSNVDKYIRAYLEVKASGKGHEKLMRDHTVGDWWNILNDMKLLIKEQ